MNSFIRNRNSQFVSISDSQKISYLSTKLPFYPKCPDAPKLHNRKLPSHLGTPDIDRLRTLGITANKLIYKQ